MNKSEKFCNFDGAYSNHETEILWSRENSAADKNDRFSKDFIFREETLSSSSWGFDDYEVKNIKKIASSLDDVETALYDGVKRPDMKEELFLECQNWSKTFPHLRLKGEHAVTPQDFVVGSCIDGRQSSVSIIGNSTELNDRRHLDEKKDAVSNPIHLKEKIIHQLTVQIWKEYLLQAESRTKTPNQDCNQLQHLPPIVNETYPRSKLKNINTLASDFPRLDGVLTVTPKVLVPRSGERSHRVRTMQNFHPDSLRLLQRDIITPPFSFDTGCPFQEKVAQTRKNISKFVSTTYLPEEEEDLSLRDMQRLRDMQLESEVKDSRTRLIPLETPGVVLAKPSSFLPPLEDRNCLPSISILGRPISYEARITSGKSLSHLSVYTRHMNRLSARSPKRRIDIRNSEFKESKLKETANLSAQNGNRKEKTLGDHNLVNLFPVVLTKELTDKRKKTHKINISSAFISNQRI